MEQKRNVIVDNLKGITAICVILGHSIQRADFVNSLNNNVYKVILTFHMPLFILLAGYTFHLSKGKYEHNYLLVRAKKLLWPTLIWTYILYFLRKYDFTGLTIMSWYDSIWLHTKQFLLHPDAVIWFLYVIFICTLIMHVGVNIFKKYNLIYLIFIAIIIYLLPEQYYGISMIRLHLPMFVAGYFIAKYRDILYKCCKYTIVPSIILYLFLFNGWNVNSNNLYQWIIAFPAMAILYYIVKNIKKEKFNLIFGFLGRYSLEIYLCQCVCLNIGFGTGITRIYTIFISATLISIILAYYTRKIKLTNVVLDGDF